MANAEDLENLTGMDGGMSRAREGELFFRVMSYAYFFGGEQRSIGNKATDAPAFKFCGFIDLLAFLVREVHESLSPETRFRPPAGRS
jgi:hypothetical protein